MQTKTKVDCDSANSKDCLGPEYGQAETTKPLPRSLLTGIHVLWRETARHGEEATTKKHTITTKGLRTQTVWNNEAA